MGSLSSEGFFWGGLVSVSGMDSFSDISKADGRDAVFSSERR